MHFRSQKGPQQAPLRASAPRPTGVTVLSVLGVLGSVFLLFAASFAFIFSGLLLLASSNLQNLVNNGAQNNFNNNQNPFVGLINQLNNVASGVSQGASFAGNLLGYAGYILMAGVGVVLLVSWGLWTGKNWARLLTLIGLALETVAAVIVVGAAFFVNMGLSIPNVSMGLALPGLGWLTADLYVLYYLTRSRVTSYFKRPQIAPLPLLVVPAPAAKTT